MKMIDEYARELKVMNSMEFTNAISKLPMDLQLKLALSRKPITVWEGKNMSSATQSIQQVNYEALAVLLLKEN